MLEAALCLRVLRRDISRSSSLCACVPGARLLSAFICRTCPPAPRSCQASRRARAKGVEVRRERAEAYQRCPQDSYSAVYCLMPVFCNGVFRNAVANKLSFSLSLALSLSRARALSSFSPCSFLSLSLALPPSLLHSLPLSLPPAVSPCRGVVLTDLQSSIWLSINFSLSLSLPPFLHTFSPCSARICGSSCAPTPCTATCA